MTTVAIALAALVVTSDQAWVEITAGQTFTDDLTFVGPLPDSNELWVGTVIGEVYRSFDNGVTWELVFQPVSYDNLIDLKNKQLRTPALNLDLLRDLRSDIPVRDRQSSNQRVLDLAGQVRGRQRLPTAKTLGALVANEVKDPGQINQIDRCFDYIYINASNGIWRASPGEPLRFEQLPTGQNLGSGRVTWLSCDRKRPGHMVGKTAIGVVLETVDFGDTWFPYTTPFERGSKVNTAGFQEGRLKVLANGRMYREREDRRGFEELCIFYSDSLDAEPGWVWGTTGPAFGITGDGVTICQNNKVWRVNDPRFAHKPIVYVQVEGEHNEHMMVVTSDDVYLSHDGAQTFDLVFTRPTQRSIDIVIVDSLVTFDDAIVWSGNVIFKRTGISRTTSESTVDVQEIFNQAPMWEVIEIGLRTYEVDGSQIAARRDDSRFQGLLPLINASVSRHEGDAFVGKYNNTNVVGYNEVISQRYPEQNIWTVVVAWDLADFLRSNSSTDRSWADVERLRRRMTYRLEDAYTRWANTTLQLKRDGLTAKQRSYLELQKREMAAYLNYMTDGQFAVFGGKAAL